MIYMFFTGPRLCSEGAHHPFRRVFLVALAALLLSAFHREVFYVVYNIVLAYILFWIAYVPGGFIRAFKPPGGLFIRNLYLCISCDAVLPGADARRPGACADPALSGCHAYACLLVWHLIESGL